MRLLSVHSCNCLERKFSLFQSASLSAQISANVWLSWWIMGNRSGESHCDAVFILLNFCFFCLFLLFCPWLGFNGSESDLMKWAASRSCAEKEGHGQPRGAGICVVCLHCSLTRTFNSFLPVWLSSFLWCFLCSFGICISSFHLLSPFIACLWRDELIKNFNVIHTPQLLLRAPWVHFVTINIWPFKYHLACVPSSPLI